MNRVEVAEELFKSGFNCAASVLTGFCEEYDLDTELAMKLACGLGGGCGEGEICGAASAGVLVVGLKYGQYILGDQATKANCRAKTSQFIDAFKKKHGALTCRDLLADKQDGDDVESVRERRRFCAGLVKSAVETLEELDY